MLRCCPVHLAGTMQGNCSIKCELGPGIAGLSVSLNSHSHNGIKLGCSPWNSCTCVYPAVEASLCRVSDERKREKKRTHDRFSYSRILLLGKFELLSARLCLLNNIQNPRELTNSPREHHTLRHSLLYTTEATTRKRSFWLTRAHPYVRRHKKDVTSTESGIKK